MDDLGEYEYLWNGSEPRWHLLHFDKVVWTVVIHFPAAGPSINDVVALRRAFPSFGERPAAEVLRDVRGKVTLVAASDLSNIEHQDAVRRAGDAGLVVESRARQAGGFLPVSTDGHALLMENEEIARRVVEKMIAAGVDVEELHAD